MIDFSGLQLIPMHLADLDEVMAIEQAVYSHPWTRKNFDDTISNRDFAWVARHPDGELLGYFVHMVVMDESHLLTIAVKESVQRQGLGRFLLQKLIEHARLMKLKSVLLEVRQSNIRALELYEALGFVEIGRRKNYYQLTQQLREDALILHYQI